jgi:hypothetical protein
MLGPGGATPARAEPAIAARTGYSCGQCHVNRTGGGMRTAFGSLYTQTILPARVLRLREGGNLLPADPDARLAYGGDVRFTYYGVSSDDYEDTSSFEIPAADLYGQVRLVRQRLAVYLDLELGSGAVSSRELFGLVSFRTGNGYVKIGKFIPPFGWALPDDDAFIREPIGFAFSAPDIGVQAGFEPGRWSLHMSVVNGNAGLRDDDRTKKFTLVTERRFKGSRIGLSAANDLSGGTTTTWAGLFGSLNLGRLSLLAEGDRRRARPDEAPSVETWAGFFEVNLLIKRGMNLKYAHDWIDPNRDVETDQRARDSFGFEYIPYPFVQLRAFVRRKDGPPQVPGSRDKQVDFEIHLFF